MLKILLLAATDFEIAPFVAALSAKNQVVKKKYDIHICIAGIGQLQTTFALTKALLQSDFDLVIQAGVAGAFSRDLNLGDLALVETEILADLRVQNKDGSTSDFFEINLMDENDFPFKDGKLWSKNDSIIQFDLPVTKSLTINTVHGNKNAIDSISTIYDAEIENMEGAAAFYTCAQLGINCVQVRAISNYVEPRNRAAWNMPLAIKNLNNYLIYELL